jgi:hypothetical protein
MVYDHFHKQEKEEEYHCDDQSRHVGVLHFQTTHVRCKPHVCPHQIPHIL